MCQIVARVTEAPFTAAVYLLLSIVLSSVPLSLAWLYHQHCSFRSDVSRHVKDLLTQAHDPSQTQVRTLTELMNQAKTLPDPIQRHLKFALRDAEGPLSSLPSTLLVKHDGTFRVSPTQPLLPTTGEEYFSLYNAGFVWHASFQVLPFIWLEARDMLLGGHGDMLVKLWGAVKLVQAKGPAMDQGACTRWVAELVWMPIALAMGGISWKERDEDSAIAELHLRSNETGTVNAEVTVKVDAEGKIRTIMCDRFMSRGDTAVLTPWMAECDEYTLLCGMWVPSSVKVSWMLQEGKFTYADFHIMSMTLNPTRQ